ncbi:MAG: type III-B CRISPR module RAMP protein Cmr4 [Deltaproteobacteria bacterium]|nr:type III-B CRISPR module RAMP protein Cmr4 [Deltaproteobacteria bacterium]
MFKKDDWEMLKFYSVSPVHAGSGMSTGAVDLPIQRERHTNWPHIQASGVKGALRAHFRDFLTEEEKYSDENINKVEDIIFGTEGYTTLTENDESLKNPCPAAISVSDAKMFAFPVRSDIAPFVWVTCPAVLERLDRDLKMMKREGIKGIDDCRNIKDNNALCLSGDIKGSVLLEDAVVDVVSAAAVIDYINDNFKELERLLLISDEMYDYCVSTCTEVQTQIKIDEKTGTADPGGLRYEELLPADSFLYSIVGFGQGGLDNHLQAENVRKRLKDVVKDFMQIGGDATLGRGMCRIEWIGGGE